MQATARSWRGRTRAAVAAAALSAGLLAAGCSSPVLSPDGSGGLETLPTPADRIHLQAAQGLSRWADAVRASGGATITFTGDLTSQIGEWEPSNAAHSASLAAGLIEAASPVPNDPTKRSEVKWPDGAKVDVNVVSAAVALAAIVDEGAGTECRGCLPLVVTDAQLANTLVETSLGPAETPVWVFTIQGSAVKVTRVAVDQSITVIPPPWNADNPPEGISIMSAKGRADARKLEVSFIGAVEDRSKPCGADYTAEAVESTGAVVVIIRERANPADDECDLMGQFRTAEVTLKKVLGDRAVLEVRQGLPVPLTTP